MNNLSIFIYIADVLPNIGGLSVFFSILLTAVVGLRAAWVIIENEEHFNFGWFSIPILFAIFACLIPSTNTIYLIAGSEAGEAVATTPEAQQILSDIQEIISIQLNNLKNPQ